MLKAVLGSALVAMTATAAGAHATLETGEAVIGSAYKAVIRIGHGCNGEATRTLRVRIPEGVISVRPMPKPGWTLETVRGAYARPYVHHGSELSEGVTEIAWSGELPDEHYDEFVFRGTIAGTLEPGTVLYFPVVQECPTRAERWIEIPAEGAEPHALEAPAPGVLLLPAAGGE